MRPVNRYRLSILECKGSEMVTDSGSLNALIASSKVTPCFLRLPASFSVLHENTSAMIAVAATGYERATAETYKTFFFPSRSRGKFNGKPVLFPALLTHRKYFVPVYAAICFSVIACAAAAL